jgi:hypothetical protein
LLGLLEGLVEGEVLGLANGEVDGDVVGLMEGEVEGLSLGDNEGSQVPPSISRKVRQYVSKCQTRTRCRLRGFTYLPSYLHKHYYRG